MASNRNKRRKILIYTVVSLLIVLLIIATFIKRNKSEHVNVSVTEVSLNTIIETVSASGKIQPEIEIKLSPDVSGEIVELYVKEGDEVKQGDLLAKIDPKIYLSNYDRLEASLNTQRANLLNYKARLLQVEAQFVNSESSFKRIEKLWQEKAISDSEYDNSKSQYLSAKAEVLSSKENVNAAEYSVKSAEATLKEANENLHKTNIISPADGIVSLLKVEKGERVAGASQFSSGTEMLRIANLSIMEIVVGVNENDIVRVNINDTAYVQVDSYENNKFLGIVTQIATSANISGTNAEQVSNYDVKIRLIQDSYKHLINEKQKHIYPFRPGMSASVDIKTNIKSNVISVPIMAVTTRIDTSNNIKVKEKNAKPNVCVFVVQPNNIIELRSVTTGVQDNNNIEITNGLQLNEKVVIAPFNAISKQLKNADIVKVIPIDDLYKK